MVWPGCWVWWRIQEEKMVDPPFLLWLLISTPTRWARWHLMIWSKLFSLQLLFARKPNSLSQLLNCVLCLINSHLMLEPRCLKTHTISEDLFNTFVSCSKLVAKYCHNVSWQAQSSTGGGTCCRLLFSLPLSGGERGGQASEAAGWTGWLMSLIVVLLVQMPSQF